MSAIFEYDWREDHARKGDLALEMAEDLAREPGRRRLVQRHPDGGETWSTNPEEGLAIAAALAAIAQAHYAAAAATRPGRDVDPPAPQVGTGWIR